MKNRLAQVSYPTAGCSRLEQKCSGEPRCASIVRIAIKTLLVLFLFLSPSTSLAGTVWSGPMISFEKVAFGNPALEANQDRITDSVWISRASNMGIFNVASEDFYLAASPANTEWAWDLAGFNSGLTITAANYEALEFNSWEVAHGGRGGGPMDTIGVAGVVHLITDDIYIDIMFTSWGSSGSGGVFSYNRSTVPEPGTSTLVAIGLSGMAARRLRVKRRSPISAAS